MLAGTDEEKDFISLGYTVVKEYIDSGRLGSARFYRQAIIKLVQYVSSSSCSFTRLDHAFLSKWKASMMKDGISENTIAAYYRAIRAICYQAIKRDLMPQEWYPFNQYLIRTEPTRDRRLSLNLVLNSSTLL